MKPQSAYYELRFELLFRSTKANEFQTLFERLMGLAYKADFMACRPWGAAGDRKNDGFLKSERRLFQVYAPNAMKASNAVSKITEDFQGAMPYWGSYFDYWCFVHNAVDGLPPHVQKLLLSFEKANPGVKLEPWGLEELRSVFRRIDSKDLSAWLGLAPTEETKANLGFKDIQIVLQSLAGKEAPHRDHIKVVPPGKIEANALSDAVSTLIKYSMVKTSLVSDFLNAWYDESLGERLANSFRAKYSELKETKQPNEIFHELQAWAGGNERGTPEHEMAVLTVLAYYFERCDIFEEPRFAQQSQRVLSHDPA